MRAPIVIAASLAGLVAGVASARAADLELRSSGDGGCCYVGYGGVAPVVIIDDQPGVVTRAWWLPPWRNRHYYPRGGAKLKTGRRHHAERSVRPRPAQSYARYWTNPPVYLLDLPPQLRREFVPPPRRTYRRQPPIPAKP